MDDDKKGAVKSRRGRQAMHDEMMQAMERLVIKRGFEAISMRGFCAEANITQRSFYNHYKNIDDLYMQFAKHSDYWLSEVIPTENLKGKGTLGKKFAVELVVNLHTNLRENKVMQKILLWGLNTADQTPRDIARQREVDSVEMIEFYEREFEGSDININVFIAILISSVYYITIHSENNLSTFVGVDFSQKKNQQELNSMIEKLIEAMYKKRERNDKIRLLRETMEAKGLSTKDVEELMNIAAQI